MKKAYFVTLWIILLLTGCYKEDIDRLFADQQKLDALLKELREQCNATNIQVKLLENLIDGTTIKKVEAFSDETTGTSGWEIVFTDNSSFKVYNGSNGQSPVIGITQLPEDERWYWTLNGDLLKDGQGNPLLAGARNGYTPSIDENGFWVINGVSTNVEASGKTPSLEINTDGYWVINGVVTEIKAQGTQAPEPRLCIGADLIDEGQTIDKTGTTLIPEAWYLSVDNGQEWVRVSGKDGNGNSGESSDQPNNCLLESVTESEDHTYILFKLTNGQEIKVPSWTWFQTKIDEINNRIDVLANLVGTGKYISEVVPLTDESAGKQTGWKIIYNDGSTSEIYNGKNGETPEINIIQENDEYYWTVNGQKLEINGQPVKASGKDGTNAPVPQVQLGETITSAAGSSYETGVWYLSVDGTTWTRISGPQGDKGEQGEDGKDGDAFFKEVYYGKENIKVEDINEAEYVVFVLINNTEIKVALHSWVESRLEELQTTINSLNQLIQSTKYIKEVETKKDPTDTYITETIIHFSDETQATIGHSNIGLKTEGNAQYWTNNGEFLTDESGNKIKANGIDGSNAPVVKLGSELPEGTTSSGEPLIATAYYLSFDNVNWVRISGDKGDQGEAGTPGTDGSDASCLFSKVEFSEDGYWVTFVIKADNSELILPTQKWATEIKAGIENLNISVSSIQQLINEGMIVKEVKELSNPHGWEIICSKNNSNESYKIFDGQNGLTPRITLTRDGDNYYWTIDGTVLTDADGNPVRANGKDGSDGSNGAGGNDGKDAPIPQLKIGLELTNAGITTDSRDETIENAAIYLSVDDGSHWTRVSGPKGEQGESGNQGSAGEQGPAGDSFFKNIDVSDENWIIFILEGPTTANEDDISIKVPTAKGLQNLQEQLTSLNERITILENLLQEGILIKSITEITSPPTGWKITCLKNGKEEIYELYNGKDGQDGSEGSAGTIPEISIKADTDGKLYWTKDNEFILVDGQKVPATGEAGSDGNQGEAGNDGKDAPVPQLKSGQNIANTDQDAENNPIEPTAVYMSVDEGITWYKISGPQGDKGDTGDKGEQGDKGDKGDSFFDSVDASNDDFIIFTMADGITTFKVPKYKEVSITFAEGNEFTIDKKASKIVNFEINGTNARNLSATILVGGIWKGALRFDQANNTGTITIQAPSEWDYNKIVLLISDNKGHAWTSSLTVTCTWQRGDPFVDTRDERIYTMYEFKSQWWLTQDMKYNTAGGYTWEEAQKACPDGWHLPNDEEWELLKENIDLTQFGNPSAGGYWWSASSVNDTQANAWSVYSPSLSNGPVNKTEIKSVRCIQDVTP